MAAAALTGVRRRMREGAARWALRRQGKDVPPLDFTARRIYIVPNRGGIGFGALLLVMLVAGLNYTNSLALFMTFLLAGFAVVAMVQCHRSLLGVQLAAISAVPAFAGGEVRVDLTLRDVTPERAADLQLTIESAGHTATTLAALDHCDGGVAALSARSPAGERGVWRMGRARLFTTAPFGLFRAWVWIHADVAALVYPRPAGQLPPPATPGDEAGSREQAEGLDEWAGLRPFRAGDSPRQVAWKAYARGAPLLVKQYHGNASRLRVFDYALLPGLDQEQRLSQLTHWVLDATARGESYSLVLPGLQLGAGQGSAHRDRCLAALALHGIDLGPVLS
ncbi:MAG TPA: DUF58 domain-containing protein, partial [Planctomycetota bacterium]|nr:DUF58 domain-containing protein [Planctomycetota bacterium]